MGGKPTLAIQTMGPALFLLDKPLNGCNYSQMMWLALAAQLSLPVPANLRVPDVRAVFSTDDFPAYLQAAGVSRTVYTRTTVQPDGTIQGCVAEVSSGDTKLDAYTCAIIVRRARFLPAKWTDGTPVYGVIRVPVSWRIGNGPPSEEEALRSTVPDLELSVNRLPKHARKIAAVSLEVAADENGRVVSCGEYPPAADSPGRHFPELIPIACEQAMKTLSVHPPFDPSGKPLRSVQTASVQFKLDH